MIDEENKGFELFSEIVEFCLEFLELLYKYRVGTLFRIWTSHTCITLYTYVILAQGKSACTSSVFEDHIF